MTLQLRLPPPAPRDSHSLPKLYCVLYTHTWSTITTSACVLHLHSCPLLWRTTHCGATPHHGATRADADPCHPPATPDAERRLDRAMWPEKYTAQPARYHHGVEHSTTQGGRHLPPHLSLLLFLQPFHLFSINQPPHEIPQTNKRTSTTAQIVQLCAAPHHHTRNPGAEREGC